MKFQLRRKPTSLDQRYRPMTLNRLSVSPNATALSPDAARWRAWSRGIALSTALVVIAGFFIRSRSDTMGLALVAGLGFLALLWAFFLSRLARRTTPLPHPAFCRWMNSLVLLGLITGLLGVTGATLSPLFWLYVPLVVGETLQDRRRGLVVGWLAWGLFCALLLLQLVPGLPESLTGPSAKTHPAGVPWFVHALGVALWYLALAVGGSLLYRWTSRHEGTLQQQQASLKLREEDALAAQQAARSEQQRLREGLMQLDANKRQFDADRQKWEQERQQGELKRAQAAQHLKDQDAAIAEQARQSQERAERIQQLQRQLDEEQHAWEEQRARAAKAFEEREAALAERTREIEEARQHFEAQRAQTTKSLMELETTLLERLKRVGEEMGQVETTRQSLEQTQQAFAAERERVTAEETQATQALQRKTEELSAREQQLRHEEETRRQAQETLAKERERLTQELTARETQLTNRLREVEAMTQRLEAERAQLEQDRQSDEMAQRTRESAEQGKERIQTQELQKLRRMLETAQQELAERKTQYATELTQWQETVRATQEALAARERDMETQRRELEEQRHELTQKAKETARTKDVESAKQLEAKAAKRARELDEREERLMKLQKELETQRRTFEQQEHQKVQLTARQEQELSSRLEQVEKLREQLEAERREVARQREQLEQTQRQARDEQQQLETARRQVHEARRTLADASLEQVPDRTSTETLGVLANEFNTPLASLHALLTTLLEGDHGEVPAGMVEALKTIMQTNERLRRLVGDALDALRIEQGQFTISANPTSLSQLLHQAEEEIQAEVKRKDLTLTHQGTDTLTVAVEPAQAHRIFSALLHNAVQYTERGGMTVTCSAQKNQAAITIADTGVGIRNEQLTQLFSKPKLGNLLRGKGLSLYLARLLAKAMGGDVALVSTELGTGTSFTVLLPIATETKASEPTETPSPSAMAKT